MHFSSWKLLALALCCLDAFIHVTGKAPALESRVCIVVALSLTASLSSLSFPVTVLGFGRFFVPLINLADK